MFFKVCGKLSKCYSMNTQFDFGQEILELQQS